MKELLGDEFDRFLFTYSEPAKRGIRFNRKKARLDSINKLINEWNLSPVEWCPTGYTYETVRPGLSPYHDAGLFYMQEPSAMSVVEEAGIRNTDIVLDLCAAPGGKSTAAAERCHVLVANEIIPGRAKILSSNIERLGFDNTIVCSAEPARLSGCLCELFDVVITDAPCSGEGMMRRDEIAVTEWSVENVSLCIERQKGILKEAAKLVRPGGKLVYSTCTFETGENEEQVKCFLEENDDFSLVSVKRFWPHKQDGEGHFCAVFRKDMDETEEMEEGRIIGKTGQDNDLCNTISYIQKILSASHVHILRSGLVKGEYFTDKKGKKIYEPSHSEIMATVYETAEKGVNLKDESLAFAYLRGDVLRPGPEQAEFKGDEGFLGVYFDGYPLGVGKRAGNVIKNHLPKGLRR